MIRIPDKKEEVHDDWLREDPSLEVAALRIHRAVAAFSTGRNASLYRRCARSISVAACSARCELHGQAKSGSLSGVTSRRHLADRSSAGGIWKRPSLLFAPRPSGRLGSLACSSVGDSEPS